MRTRTAFGQASHIQTNLYNLPVWTVSSALQDTDPAMFLAVQV